MTTTEGLRSEPVQFVENRKLDLFIWESTRAESRPVIAFLSYLGPLQPAADVMWDGEYATALRDVAETRLACLKLAQNSLMPLRGPEPKGRTEARERLDAEIFDLEAGISTLTSKQ